MLRLGNRGDPMLLLCVPPLISQFPEIHYFSSYCCCYHGGWTAQIDFGIRAAHAAPKIAVVWKGDVRAEIA
jgi:hypothetical protein